MVRLGIMGTANIAEKIINAAKSTNRITISAIAGRNSDKAALYARNFDIPKYYGNYEDLLSSNEIDAVYIPLVNSLHAEWTIKALKAGFNVLCEKPLTTKAEDSIRIFETAKQHNLSVLEGFMYRHHPMYNKIQDIILSGQIGELSTMNGCFTWFCDDRSETPANFELGGGALLDVGCYPVHFFRQILKTEPVKVFAFENRSTVDDTMLGTLMFPNNILAQFETSIANFERHRAEVVGTKGSIEISHPWVSSGQRCSLIINIEGKDKQILEFDPINTYTMELDYFATLVENNKFRGELIEDSINNIKVLDALFLSAKNGEAILL